LSDAYGYNVATVNSTIGLITSSREHIIRTTVWSLGAQVSNSKALTSPIPASTRNNPQILVLFHGLRRLNNVLATARGKRFTWEAVRGRSWSITQDNQNRIARRF